jgi:hypothetical protein
LTLESSERELLREEWLALEEHLESCPACAAFQSFRRDLRSCIQEESKPGLTSELSDQVRLRCRAELDSLSRAGRDSETLPASVPWLILAALLILTGLTLTFFIPTVGEFFETQKVTVETVLVFVVVLQNALMLFFAPLLMRRDRLSRFHL